MTSLFGQFQLLQSGYSGPEEKDIPLDLNWKSLSAWLVDCRLSAPNSIEKHDIASVSAKSLVLLRDLASETSRYAQIPEIRSICDVMTSNIALVPWTYNYFDFLSIYDAVLAFSGEPTSKSLLGNFQSSFLHSWDQVRYQWIKGNAHVAHATLLLSQAIGHELPSLRSTLDRQQGNLQKIATKAQDLLKTIDIEKQVYERLFDKHGIQVVSADSAIGTADLESKLETELLAVIVASLPLDAENLIQFIRGSGLTTQAIRFYETWMKTTALSAADHISSLHRLISCDSSTLVPNQTINADVSSNTEDKSEEDAIDWGDFDISNETDISSINIVSSSSSNDNPSGKLIQEAVDALDILLIFFRQRNSELSQKDDFLTLVMGRTISIRPEDLNRFDNSHSIIQFVEALEQVKQKLVAFSKKISLLDSRVGAKEVVGVIIQKRSKIIQLHRSFAVIQSKREETEIACQTCVSKIDRVKAFTYNLKTQLESTTSQLCGGRAVSISMPNL